MMLINCEIDLLNDYLRLECHLFQFWSWFFRVRARLRKFPYLKILFEVLEFLKLSGEGE